MRSDVWKRLNSLCHLLDRRCEMHRSDMIETATLGEMITTEVLHAYAEMINVHKGATVALQARRERYGRPGQGWPWASSSGFFFTTFRNTLLAASRRV